MNVSVIVPVHRNRATVVELHQRLTETAKREGWRLQQVFVDDACPEGTRDELAALAESDVDMTVVALRENQGQHVAVAIGAWYAHGDVVAVMDADLQDQPEDLPRIVAALDENVDLAVAVRSVPYQAKGRTLASRAFKTVVSRLSPLPKGYGVFLATRHATLAEGLRRSGRRTYLPISLARVARCVVGVPIERRQRPSGRSSYGPVRLVRIAAMAARTLLQPSRSRKDNNFGGPSALVEWSLNANDASDAARRQGVGEMP